MEPLTVLPIHEQEFQIPATAFGDIREITEIGPLMILPIQEQKFQILATAFGNIRELPKVSSIWSSKIYGMLNCLIMAESLDKG